MPVVPRHTPDSELSVEERLEINRWRNVRFFTQLTSVLAGLVLAALISGKWFFIVFMLGTLNSIQFADIDRQYRSGKSCRVTLLFTMAYNITLGSFLYWTLW